MERKKKKMAGRGRACERLPLLLLPIFIASCGEAEETRRGEDRGINSAHSPTPRDYCALTACGNRRWKANGPFWATEDPHPGRGVEVAGLVLRQRSVMRVGWQALPAGGRHLARGRQSGRPATRRARQLIPAFRFRGLTKTAHLIKAGS